MEKGCMLKPHHLTCLLVRNNRPEDLSCPKAIAFSPEGLNTGLATILVHGRFICRLKGSLPGQTETISVVPRIFHSLLNESLSDLRVDQLEDLSSICDGCGAALRGRLQTEKPDLHRPFV